MIEKLTHLRFLSSEIKAQSKLYDAKLHTKALYLLERGEVFFAKIASVDDKVLNLIFSNKRHLPRKNDHLDMLILPKEIRDYRNWGDLTYGELVEKYPRDPQSIVCIYTSPAKEAGCTICGFHGLEVDFANELMKAKNVAVTLGPQKPPIEYLQNLLNVVNRQSDSSPILDEDFQPQTWTPELLDNKKSVFDFIYKQLQLTPSIILQGPPGTGKSYMIAQLCEKLCSMGHSVLVTALTNRALIEVAEKPALKEMLSEGKILKTNLTLEEKHEVPQLIKARDVVPIQGRLILSTYYITSGAVLNNPNKFDYVIMDEASQALLAMFEVATLLGLHNLWIGDVKQLPPVVAINDDKINKRGYQLLRDGLDTLTTQSTTFPIYQLTETYRLPPRATEYTKIFYRGNFSSRQQMESFDLQDALCSQFLHPQGGPALIKTDLPVGKDAPEALLSIVTRMVNALFKANKRINVAVLTCKISTTKALQWCIGTHQNLIVETVARVQGLTTDVVIFAIPNTNMIHSLETRLFNVATSRAKGYTIIVSDKDILAYRHMSPEVRQYLQKLDQEFCFYLPATIEKRIE